MPRPANKTELLDLSKKNYEILMHYIDILPLARQNATFPKGTMNRNLRDVLMHLHHWHLLMIDWYTVGMKGQKPDMPAEGYTWNNTPDLNKWIWQKYQDTSFDEACRHLKSSHKKVQNIIGTHTNEELFEKKRYKWTGTTSLGAYLVSATSSHYDWALKLIKKNLP